MPHFKVADIEDVLDDEDDDDDDDDGKFTSKSSSFFDFQLNNKIHNHSDATGAADDDEDEDDDDEGDYLDRFFVSLLMSGRRKRVVY